MCKTQTEDRKHYEYECEIQASYIDKLETVYDEDWENNETETQENKEGEGKTPTKEEWNLEKKDMETRQMILIAKARWIWHCERCMIDMRKS